MGLKDKGSNLISSLRLKPGARPPLEGIYAYLLALLIGYAIADLSILYMRPQMLPTTAPQAKPSRGPLVSTIARSEYNLITDRNIFNSDGKIPPPLTQDGQERIDQDAPAVLSQLPLTLEGTIVHANPARSVATIVLRNRNESSPFSVGQNIDNLAQVTKIERRKVTFRNLNNKRLEYIEIPEDSQFSFGMRDTKAPQPNEAAEIVRRGEFDFNVSRADVEKYTADLSSILNQARMVPNIIPGSGGQVEGFRFVSIQPDSIYEKLGFKPMDIIKEVNGEPVNSPTKAMELYNALRTENRISLVVERNGRPETFTYDVSD